MLVSAATQAGGGTSAMKRPESTEVWSGVTNAEGASANEAGPSFTDPEYCGVKKAAVAAEDEVLLAE